ncbi:hypothetical protein Cylst_6500 (plasmid) [Cylindrospermum stagnale PCC 7417]|jgi:hypothetical protein|uniref:Uncharacterized protein n=1 Tax=Cylindrospermum stagnale PCC 7417 TaxID=56107 RepID=K9X880_9NOST|nr:hypothetical protein Cylst_6500 [Cylindrospermum stagnale PCC 7417]
MGILKAFDGLNNLMAKAVNTLLGGQYANYSY